MIACRTIKVRTFGFIVAIVCLAMSGSIYSAPQRPPVDWIILVDTSKSMIGKGQRAKNIFGPVKETLRSFIDERIIPGDRVDLFRFARSYRFITDLPITDEEDKADLKRYIDSLNINESDTDGNYTHTGNAVSEALDRSQKLFRADPLSRTSMGPRRRQIIVLLTDGVESIDHNATDAIPINSINVQKLEMKPHVFFVWLGEDTRSFEESSLNQFKQKLGEKGILIDRSGGVDIESIIGSIGEKMESLFTIRIYPLTFDLGQLEAGSITGDWRINAESYKRTGIRLSLIEPDKDLTLIEPSESVIVEKDKETPISLRLKVSDDAPDDEIKGKIEVRLDETVVEGNSGALKQNPSSNTEIGKIEFSLRVYHRSWFSKAISIIIKGSLWTILITLVIGAIFVVVVVRYRVNVAKLLRRMFDRQPIEAGPIKGKLILLGSMKENQTIDLTAFDKKSINLNEIEMLRNILGDSEAELTISANRGGKVRLRPIKGTVKVEEAPLASPQELTDGDKIEIGEARLIFHEVKQP